MKVRKKRKTNMKIKVHKHIINVYIQWVEEEQDMFVGNTGMDLVSVLASR
jgi:hypothetical protein